VPATRRLGPLRLLVLPACWAALELLRAHQPLGGFPWGLLALTQHDGGPLLPLARVVGGYGVAALIVAVNLAVAFWLRALLTGPAPAAAADAPAAGRPPGLGCWCPRRRRRPGRRWTWWWSRVACAAATGSTSAGPPGRCSPTTSA
jgi:apolipoprotein N-acyltransferase